MEENKQQDTVPLATQTPAERNQAAYSVVKPGDPQPRKHSKVWGALVIVFASIQLFIIAAWLIVILLLNSKADAGESGTEIITVALVGPTFLAGAITAVLGVIASLIYIFVSRPKQIKLAMTILVLIVSLALTSLTAIGLYNHFVVVPQEYEKREQEVRDEASRIQEEFEYLNTNPDETGVQLYDMRNF